MRTDLLVRRTRKHFPRLDVAEIKISPIQKGGSDRKFYRVRCSEEQALILVKYNFSETALARNFKTTKGNLPRLAPLLRYRRLPSTLRRSREFWCTAIFSRKTSSSETATRT